jgi:phage-related minor tail protein
MGEAGPEAILPLQQMPGGDLGVKAQVGGTPQVNVIINNNAPNTQASASQDSQGNINVIIEQVEGAIQSRMSRGTGLAPAMDARYRKRY